MTVGIKGIFGAPPPANPARMPMAFSDARVIAKGHWYYLGLQERPRISA